MSKKSEFINYVERAIENFSEEMNDDAKIYWESFKSSGAEKEKPVLTDGGKLILAAIQKCYGDGTPFKARDIAEELFISSRTVSGSMRKLCLDNFVERIGSEPVIYSITDKGKSISL